MFNKDLQNEDDKNKSGDYSDINANHHGNDLEDELNTE